jgi:uncharacterized protein YciI
MAQANLTLEDFFRDRHPEIPLHVVFMKPTDRLRPPSDPEGAEMLRRHFLFLLELEESGKLFASGPLDAGTPSQEGMCILAVATREEAEAIAAEEPFGKAGWRVNSVRSWQLNEGETVALGKRLLGRD